MCAACSPCKRATTPPFRMPTCTYANSLVGQEYRFAGASFFERVVTASGMGTIAFKEAVTVEKFVKAHSNSDVNCKLWKWITNPPSNLEKVTQYLVETPISEAPLLEEHHHYRSFEGDEIGRYSGIRLET